MTVKEYLVKFSYDDAGMKRMQQDMQTAVGAGRYMSAGLTEAANVLDQRVSVSFDNLGRKVRTVTSILEEGGKATTVVFRDFGTHIEMVSQKAQTFGTVAGSLSAEFEKITSRALLVAPVWLALRYAMTETIQLFQQSIAFMVEWEEQMARIQVVTGATKDQLGTLSNQIQDIAERFALSNKDVAESANQWLRMGATMENVVPLLEATSKLTLISGGKMEDSAKSINSIISAFGLNAEQANTAVEKLIAIEGNSHVSLEVLLQGFEKAGLTAKAMGLSFDQLAGYIVAVNEKSRQSGDLIGTQLRSMFIRLGSTAIDTAQNISKVPFFLDQLGQATRTHTPQLRNMGDIINDLAKSWNTLSNAQQAGLARALGGNLRSTAVIALLTNMNEAIKASGTAAEDSSKAIGEMTSTVTGKVHQLQDEWGKFVSQVSATGIIQTFLENVRQRVELLRISIGGLHLLWDSIFNPKKVADAAAASDFARVAADQKQASLDRRNLPLPTDANGNAATGLQTEKQIKDAIHAIEEKSVLTRRDELQTIKEELNLLGDGITADGKDLTTQVEALRLRKEKLEVQRQIAQAQNNEETIVAQLRAAGASDLQIQIQKLAFLKAINASQEEISKQQAVVDTAGITQYKAIEDEIVTTLLSQQKILGETAIQQVQNKIALEDQLGIHRQGIDLLKEQLDLHKAIADQAAKTPLERSKELRDLIRKTHSPDEFKETDSTKRVEDQLSRQARKKGISDETIDAILHPERSSTDRGGDNSLQTELRNGLSDPLGKNINDLSSTIKILADAINRPASGPNLTSPIQYHNPESPVTTAQRGQNVPSYAQSFRGKDVTVDLGGINVTVHAHTKKELQGELTAIMQELIASHMVRPDSKMNQAIKKVVDSF